MGLPEGIDAGETVSDCLPNCDVRGVTTAIIPAVSRPELPELRAAMQPVPVEADDVGRWVVRECRSGQLLDDVPLFQRAPPRMCTRRPRQSVGSENSCANRSAYPRE